MDTNTIERLVWAVIGVVAGIALWVLATGALMLFGLSFYSVIAAPFLALAIWMVSAFLLPKRVSKRSPQAVRHRLMPFLVGMLVPVLVLVITMVVAHPHAILPS
jgi:membrane protease YdiL (CAAX protease family)